MNAIIIGGTSGIGKALIPLLIDAGYHVVVTGRRIENLDEIKKVYRDKVTVFQQDVMQLEKNVSVWNNILESVRTIDILIYSSGVGKPNYQLDWELEFPTLQTNVMAAVQMYGLAYKKFRQQGYGHLVGISSIAGIRGNRHVPAYFASKAFQNNYLESLWLKGKKSKAIIFVTDIVPGFVDTDMAIGKTFWMSSTQKAANQIFSAIQKKKKKVFITKRWWIIAHFLRFVPSRLLLKF